METDIINYLESLGGERLGAIGAIIAIILIFWKRFNVLFKIAIAMYEEKTFEKYNSNLTLIQSYTTTYSVRTVFLRKESQEIFTFMKVIYDKVSITNIPDKTIKFKLFEVPDNQILYSNVVRFLDYYKSRNGVKIILFMHESFSKPGDTKPKQIATDIRTYIQKAGIHGVKIISREEK